MRAEAEKGAKKSRAQWRAVEVRAPFPSLVNECAFLDRVNLSIYGELREHPSPFVHVLTRKLLPPTRRRLFSNCITARCLLSGNSIRVHCGKVTKLRTVPHATITVLASNAPIIRPHLRSMVSALVARGRVRVAQVELTFDISPASLPLITRDAFTRAARTRVAGFDRRYWTAYFGSAHSAWQARLYYKTFDRTTLRIEFIFRRRALLSAAVVDVDDLQQLRRMKLRTLLCLREMDITVLSAIVSNRASARARIAVNNFIGRIPWQALIAIVRGRYHLDIREAVRISPRQELLEQMQASLIV
jgi:hypothetical protein